METMIIRGRYISRTFIPNDPLPDAEGTAELVITPAAPRSGQSVAEAFGTAPVLRSGDEILAQIRSDRDDWGRPLIYLDANVVIRLVEGDAATRAPLVARLAPALGAPRSLVTSRLSRLECRIRPLRTADLATLAQFEVFFAGLELVLAEVTAAVIERATDLRASTT